MKFKNIFFIFLIILFILFEVKSFCESIEPEIEYGTIPLELYYLRKLEIEIIFNNNHKYINQLVEDGEQVIINKKKNKLKYLISQSKDSKSFHNKANSIYLQNKIISSKNYSTFKKIAKIITKDYKNQDEIVKSLSVWIYCNIDNKIKTDISNPFEVLKIKKGKQIERSILLVLFLRVLGIPSKMNHGLKYSNGMYFYHTWVSYYNKKWKSIDIDNNQKEMDFSYIKLISDNLESIDNIRFNNDLTNKIIESISIKILNYIQEHQKPSYPFFLNYDLRNGYKGNKIYIHPQLKIIMNNINEFEYCKYFSKDYIELCKNNDIYRIKIIPLKKDVSLKTISENYINNFKNISSKMIELNDNNAIFSIINNDKDVSEVLMNLILCVIIVKKEYIYIIELHTNSNSKSKEEDLLIFSENLFFDCENILLKMFETLESNQLIGYEKRKYFNRLKNMLILHYM